jgi:SSS family solute:Na+ symporter
MSVAFLFAVLWRKTSRKAINLVLSLGTVFSLGVGILYYTNLIFNGVHFLYVSFLIFVLLSVFVWLFSLISKESDESVSIPSYKPVKVNKSVKISWSVLIVVMIGMYVLFN